MKQATNSKSGEAKEEKRGAERRDLIKKKTQLQFS